MNRTLTVAAVTLSLVAARSASADTKSWTAVKKVIGKGDTVVFSADLSKLRSSAAFQAGLSLLMDANDEAKTAFDQIKTTCGFDLTTALSDFTVVLQGEDHPLMVMGLDGIDEAKAVTCMGAVAGAMMNQPAPKMTGKKIGKVTEYSVKGEAKKLYFAWLAKDVIAFTENPNDKKDLTKRVGGKGPIPDLAKLLAKTFTTSAIWFAVAEKDKEDGRQILGGYGKVDLAAGTFNASGAIMMSKPDEATGLADEANAGLADARKEMASKSAELARAMSTIAVKASGVEVQISGSIADKDIPKIVPQLDHLF